MGRPDRRKLLILSALLSLACGEAATEPAPPPNRAPEASGSIPAQSVVVGETVTLDVSSYFSDPDGDILTHTANPSDPGVILRERFGQHGDHGRCRPGNGLNYHNRR